MEFINDPVKSKKVFILMLILTIVFFLAGGVLGFFYYKEHKNVKTLKTDKTNLETQLANSEKDLQQQVADLKTANEKLASENKNLSDQITQNSARSDKIKAYNATLGYVADVVEIHGGFQGWTDAEYQTGRTYAQATGDQNFVNTVDWAWNREDVPAVERFVGFLRAVETGINTNLWK